MPDVETLQECTQACLIGLNKIDDYYDDILELKLAKVLKPQHASYSRFYTLVSQCHSMKLKAKSLEDKIRCLEALRDRKFIMEADISKADVSSDNAHYGVLQRWIAEAKHYEAAFASYCTAGVAAQAVVGDQLCFNVTVSENQPPTEITFTTRYRQHTLVITIKYCGSEVTLTSDLALSDLPGVTQTCLDCRVPLDLYLRQYVWDLLDKVILEEEKIPDNA